MEVVEGMLTGNAEKIADGHARKVRIPALPVLAR
jgi:hypothetical protein